MRKHERAARGRVSRAVAVSASVALLGCATACGHHAPETSVAERPRVDVKIASIRLGSIPELLHGTGSTRALRQENVGSPVDGQVVELRVLEGDAVQAGDVLARVETKESVAARTGAQLLLARAQTEAERQNAAADLERARRTETVLEIHAPFAAIVTARGVNQGEFVSAGGKLATLVDLGSLCFVVRLPARDLGRVAVGQSASVAFESMPDRRFGCRVENVTAQIDPVAQLAEVRLRFLDPTSLLRSDMFGAADIVVARHAGALLVPDGAVLRDDATGLHVLVEAVGDTLGVIRPVEIGIETPDTVEVRGAALRPGLHVVVEGHYGLPDSTAVRVAAP